MNLINKTPKPLHESVVLVTGALAGIGRATAVAFAKEGAKVVVSGRDEHKGNALAEELKGLDTEAVFIKTDIRYDTEIEKLVDATIAQFGSLDRHILGLQRRLSPTNRYLHDLIKDGYVGKLRSVRLHVSMNYFQALRSSSLKWTIDPENFSSVIAIYAGHFLDALFTVVGKPISFSALTVNQFPEVTDLGTNEVIATTTPDQLVMHGLLTDNAIFSVHIEGGKRNGSGVELDITGDQGDIKVTNVSAFGGVGENYSIKGAHGDNLPLEILEIPESYTWTPKSDLASAADELAHLYAAYALDVKNNSQLAVNFEDGVWMHEILDGIEHSSKNAKVTLT